MFAFVVLVSALLFTVSLFTVSKGRVIENPILGAATDTFLDFPRIELTDSITVLHTVVNYTPNEWFSISPETFIEAESKKYKLIASDGIKPGEKILMPDSGKVVFTLVFEPIPVDTKRINFKEYEDRGWRIWDIDLTGCDINEPPIGLPAELTKLPTDDVPMPVPLFKSDTTTIYLHVLNYHPEMGDEFSYFLNTLVRQENQLPSVKLDREGNATIRMLLHGITQLLAFQVGDVRVSGVADLMPGETLDIYIDTRYSGLWAMDNNRENFKYPCHGGLWHNGCCAAYDRAGDSVVDIYSLNLYSGSFGDYRMNGDEYIDYVLKQYHEELAKINNDETMIPLARKFWVNSLNSELLRAVINYKELLKRNYWYEHHNWGTPVDENTITAQLTSAHLARIASVVDVNNPSLLFTDYYELASSIWNDAGLGGKLFSELAIYRQKYQLALNGDVTQNDIDTLRTLSMSFYADVVEAKQQEVKHSLLKMDQAWLTISSDVPDDKILDVIITPHKGKVVVVDLWNTWCGPCRAAIKAHEPLKQALLNSDDIIWIYIADESSPKLKYAEMLSGIKGIHYYLTERQYRAIMNCFKVVGIPYYILIDRWGKVEGREDMCDDMVFRSAILAALEEER